MSEKIVNTLDLYAQVFSDKPPEPVPPIDCDESPKEISQPEAENVEDAPAANDEGSTPQSDVPSQVEHLPQIAPSMVPEKSFQLNLSYELNIVQGCDGRAFSFESVEGQNSRLLPVGSSELNNRIYSIAAEKGVVLRRSMLSDINTMLTVYAGTAAEKVKAYYRNAEIPNGIIVDSGDEYHHVKITAGKVEILRFGSPVLFYRTPVMLPIVIPADEGSLDLLKKYLNLHPIEVTLLIAWITYTLAHVKSPSTTFVILALFGGQGTAKSFTTRLLKRLIDPTQVGLQAFPKNEKDLAIAAQNTLVIALDNVRQLRLEMSDLLCIIASGGTITSRQLYSDDGQALIRTHAAVIINGIHPFVSQSDLSQRCLPLQLRPIDEKNRKSEVELEADLEADLPHIMRGLFDLIAEIFIHLPDVEVTYPERMYDFCKWLAAMEKAQGVPAGVYQQEYSRLLKQGQLDTILDNELAAGVYVFAEEVGDWVGTPTELLQKLNDRATLGIQRAKSWPGNPIALSKRLVSLQASLASQGVKIELSRGKNRKITITYNGGNDEQ